MEATAALKTTGAEQQAGRRNLSLLSFNIQTGVETRDFHEYVTKSWKT